MICLILLLMLVMLSFTFFTVPRTMPGSPEPGLDTACGSGNNTERRGIDRSLVHALGVTIDQSKHIKYLPPASCTGGITADEAGQCC